MGGVRLLLFAVFCLFSLARARTDFSAWKDSVRVYFNTSSTGAALAAPVKNFPLFLRFDSTLMKANKTAPGGGDVRFTDPDGAELPVHIERWDTGFYKGAEIWVNVPQVDAGSTADFVVMYWGNPSATMSGAVKVKQGGSDVYLGGDNPVNGRFVFDTAYGYAGVWHLDEDVAGVGTKAAHRDATPAGNHGDDSARDPSGSGVVGRAQQFDAGHDYIAVPNSAGLQLASTMTFSAWIKSSKFSGLGTNAVATQVNPIVRKGDINPNPFQFCVAGGKLSLALDSGDTGGVTAPKDLETGKWLYVGGVWDGKNVQLYLDGALAIDKAPSRAPALRKDTRPVYIGGRPTTSDASSLDLFDGIIDEVQVSRPARSGDWFKLSYENQKAGSKLLSFVAVSPPKDTLPLIREDYSTWAHSRKLILNTTAEGADVKTVVGNFPLLVRLKSPDFDFSQAQASGADMRFADADGSPLPVSIERWASDKAELWVRVPKVDGAGKSDFITMYWGKPGAPDIHRGSLVFDTSDGWSGVWHLNNGAAGKGAKGVYQDATAFNNNGDDNVTANPSEGLIGLGQSFGGAVKGADCVRIPAAPSLNIPEKTFTFSAWVKGSIFSQETNDVNPILRKGDANPNNYQFYLRNAGLAVSLDQSDNTGRYGSTILETDKWYHVAATWGQDKIMFFVNGTHTNSSTKSEALTHDERPLYIGGRDAIGADSSDQFDGMIDEVEFARVERDPDWIKLAYENQRPDSRLVEFAAPADTPKPMDTAKVAVPNDTILAPGQSIIHNGRIRVANPADASGSVRVAFGSATDRSRFGVADAGESISLHPAGNAGDMPPVSLEINAGLSGNVSLFLILKPAGGLASVRSFGEGVGSWTLAEAGEYFLGRDTAAPTLKLIDEGVTADDSSWIEVLPVDNVENLVLSYQADIPGHPENGYSDAAPAQSGQGLRLAFKGKPGLEFAKVALQLRDGSLEGTFPSRAGGSYQLVRRLRDVKAPVGLKGDLIWRLAGIPLNLKEHAHFSDLSGGAKDKELFGAVWRNWENNPKPGEYAIFRDDDTLPTGTGIWLAGRSPLDSLSLGEAYTVTAGKAGVFRVPLVKGWNQVTSPVLEKLPWPVASKDTVARDLSKVKPLQAIDPSSGKYVDADSLEPWRGFFVYSGLDTVIELLHPAGTSGASGAGKPVAAAKSGAAAAEGERAPVEIVLEPDSPGQGGIGALSRIRLGAARYAADQVGYEDEPMPPAAADGPALAAVRSGRGLKSDLLGFKPASDFTWKLAWSAREAGASGVSGASGVARVRVASLRLPAGMVLWAASPLRKLAQPAVLGAEMDVLADASDTLVFWAAPAGRAFPGLPRGYGPAPLRREAAWVAGPGGGRLRLALPASTGVRAECWDASGRRLARLRRERLAPGYYEFAWADAWDRSGTAARARGLMIITLAFDPQTGPGAARMVFKTSGP
jgi:hypothetical protein